MILIYENIYFWNRKKGQPKYLFWLQYSSSKDGEWNSVAEYITDKLEKPYIEMNKNIQIAISHMVN